MSIRFTYGKKNRFFFENVFLVLPFFPPYPLFSMDFFSRNSWMEIDLSNLTQQGHFLAPEETEASFFCRKDFFYKAPLQEIAPSTQQMTKSLFDFQFQRAPYFVSKKRLMPWQGAVLWNHICDKKTCYPEIQLHPKPYFSSFYPKDEILAHELVHMARFAFKEPLFEEVLAYQTSKSRLRRFLGPLFLYPIEPSLLLLSFLPFLLLSRFFFLPHLVFLFFLIRLLFLQTLFYLSQKKLLQLGANAKHCLPILVRLSDREIFRISIQSLEKTRVFFKIEKKRQVRIRVLLQLYLPILYQSS